MMYPGTMHYSCNSSLLWESQWGVSGACAPPCVYQPLCDPGQSPYFLPQPSVNLPPSGNLQCGTNYSDCYICAPPSPLNILSLTSSTSFNISIHCSADAKKRTYFSGTYRGTAMIDKAQFVGDTNDLLVTVSAKGNDTGTVRYEWCDKRNHYGSWIVFFQAVPLPPVTSPTVSPIFLEKQCGPGQAAFFLPQNQISIPKDLLAPYLSCSQPGLSLAQVCAPASPVPPGNTFMISILLGKKAQHADWVGYTAMNVVGSFSAVSPKNYTGTFTGGPTAAGWLRVEWCDTSDRYGSFISALGKAVIS